MSSSRAPHAHLPEPDVAAAAHSERVAARVREAIEDAGGAIDFARYMELVLYAPGLGYYSAGTRKFGAAGDFVTAPEISALFAGCVARQAAEVLEAVPGVEMGEAGAGSGALAAGVLAELERLERLPSCYWILERSATLRERQRTHLEARVPHLLPRVAWLDDLPAPGFRGVVLANELLDAFPARRFRLHGEGLRECCVTCDERGFAWVERPPADTQASRAVDAIRATLPEPLPEGYVFEWAPAREAWIDELARRLARGLVLVFDYGYGRAEFYHPERRDGTLACHYRHRAHADPFVLPGLQDLSMHVDFTALAEAAIGGGLEVVGYTTQAQFLLATGLLEVCADSRPGTREHAELTGAIKRLTLPGEMGEAVKVLGLARDFAAPLAGFSGRDLRGRLG